MFAHSARAMVMVAFAIVVGMGASQAYELPPGHSNIDYFYVFGTDGDPLMGAEDHVLELFIEVPAQESRPVVISVFDPDTSGKKDWRTDPILNEWNTATEFTVYGSKKLDSQNIFLNLP